jgi:hypothetical protein
MSNAIQMAMIKPIQNLFEEISSDVFFKPSSRGNKVEDLSTFSNFEYNIADSSNLIISFNILASSVVNNLKDILMIKFLHSCYFC